MTKSIYKDFDLRMIQNPMTKDITTLIDTDAIRSSIKNIIFTNLKEKSFIQNFGGNIRDYLFEFIDPLIAQTISLHITDLIYKHEPRVKNVKVIAKEGETEGNDISINIYYEFKDIEIKTEQFDLILRKLR